MSEFRQYKWLYTIHFINKTLNIFKNTFSTLSFSLIKLLTWSFRQSFLVLYGHALNVRSWFGKIFLSSFYILKASQLEKCLRQNSKPCSHITDMKQNSLFFNINGNCTWNIMRTLQLWPWYHALIKNVEDNTVFLAQKVFNSDISPLLPKRKKCATTRKLANENKQFKGTKAWIYNLYFWTDKAVMGTVVNRALSSLHGGSLEIMLTVL